MTGPDTLPLWAIFGILCVVMISFIEFGFRFGQRPGSKKNKAQLSQVRAIMGASLGLVAFMLAFSFSMAQNHYEKRVEAYFLEISAIDSAYRGADLLEPHQTALARELLIDFGKLRLDTARAARQGSFGEVIEMVRESERMHDALWAIADAAISDPDAKSDSSIFGQAILAMINAHDARLQATLFNRISPVIWIVLMMMAALSMMTMGYQAGLTGTRSSLASWTLAITFSVVMALVTDLDRPNMTLFHLNQDLLVELLNRMTDEGVEMELTLPET